MSISESVYYFKSNQTKQKQIFIVHCSSLQNQVSNSLQLSHSILPLLCVLFICLYLLSFCSGFYIHICVCLFYCSQRSEFVLTLLYHISIFNFINPFMVFLSFLYYILNPCSSLFIVKALDTISFLLSTALTTSAKPT